MERARLQTSDLDSANSPAASASAISRDCRSGESGTPRRTLPSEHQNSVALSPNGTLSLKHALSRARCHRTARVCPVPPPGWRPPQVRRKPPDQRQIWRNSKRRSRRRSDNIILSSQCRARCHRRDRNRGTHERIQYCNRPSAPVELLILPRFPILLIPDTIRGVRFSIRIGIHTPNHAALVMRKPAFVPGCDLKWCRRLRSGSGRQAACRLAAGPAASTVF
jgi:hypothetical protein